MPPVTAKRRTTVSAAVCAYPGSDNAELNLWRHLDYVDEAASSADPLVLPEVSINGYPAVWGADPARLRQQRYRKVHSGFVEKAYWSAGDVCPVVETALGPLGLARWGAGAATHSLARETRLDNSRWVLSSNYVGSLGSEEFPGRGGRHRPARPGHRCHGIGRGRRARRDRHGCGIQEACSAWNGARLRRGLTHPHLHHTRRGDRCR
jgi:hypothetical protein